MSVLTVQLRTSVQDIRYKSRQNHSVLDKCSRKNAVSEGTNKTTTQLYNDNININKKTFI